MVKVCPMRSCEATVAFKQQNLSTHRQAQLDWILSDVTLEFE